MKLKLMTIAGAALLAFGLVSCGGGEDAATEESMEETATEEETGGPTSYTIDPAASQVNWAGSMVGMYTHTGTVDLTKGELVVESNMVTGGSFEVMLNTLNTNDSEENYGGKDRGMLIGHLLSPEFLGAEEFNTATFVVKSSDGNIITGDLTIKGVTNEESVTDVVLTSGEGMVSASGKLKFDRQKYGVSYTMGSKDMVIGDEVMLQVKLVGAPM